MRCLLTTPHVADWLLNLLIFFPCMICYRRGIWDLFTYYIYQGHDPLSHWVIFGIGCLSMLAFYLYPPVDSFLLKKSKWVRIIGVRITLAIGGIFALAYWRGVWGLADYYTEEYGWKAGAVGFVVSYSVTIICQTSRTIVFPPFVLAVDPRPTVLVPTTMLKMPLKANARDFTLYTLDVMLTFFFNLTLTVLAWWGLLKMEDAINFPKNYAAAANFLIGFVFVLIMYFLEIPLAILLRCLTKKPLIPMEKNFYNFTYDDDNEDNIKDRKKIVNQRIPRAFYYRGLNKEDWIRLVFNDIVFLIGFMGEGFLWLGLWYLDVEYLLPDLMKGGWLNHIMGTVLLICFQIMSYGGICGCAFDLDFSNDNGENDDELFVYTNQFVRYFKKVKRDLKLKEKIQDLQRDMKDDTCNFSGEGNTTNV